MKINLDFGEVVMSGCLFDTEIGRRFFKQLPVRISLQTWGDESYGSIGVDLGEEKGTLCLTIDFGNEIYNLTLGEIGGKFYIGYANKWDGE